MQTNGSSQQDLVRARFDIQQIIYLPISMENLLTNYHNLTSYNAANKGGDSLTWHYGQNKCSNVESCSVVYTALKAHDQIGI